MARPKKEINLEDLEKLAALQCTDEEISAFFGVSRMTLARRKRNKAFAEVLEAGRAKGRSSLRRNLFKQSETNAACAIFLAKNLLGYSDRFEHTQPPDTSFRVTVEYANRPDET